LSHGRVGRGGKRGFGGGKVPHLCDSKEKKKGNRMGKEVRSLYSDLSKKREEYDGTMREQSEKKDPTDL